MIIVKPDLLSIRNKATGRPTPFHLKTFGNIIPEYLLVLHDNNQRFIMVTC